MEHKTSVVKLNLKLQCYSQAYVNSDAYVLVTGNITVVEVGVA